MLKITPADKASIDAIVQNRRKPGVYGGLTAHLRKLRIGAGVWIEVPENVSISRHQQHVAAIGQSLYIHQGIRFMTRRDTANNRVAIIRVE